MLRLQEIKHDFHSRLDHLNAVRRFTACGLGRLQEWRDPVPGDNVADEHRGSEQIRWIGDGTLGDMPIGVALTTISQPAGSGGPAITRPQPAGQESEQIVKPRLIGMVQHSRAAETKGSDLVAFAFYRLRHRVLTGRCGRSVGESSGKTRLCFGVQHFSPGCGGGQTIPHPDQIVRLLKNGDLT